MTKILNRKLLSVRKTINSKFYTCCVKHQLLSVPAVPVLFWTVYKLNKMCSVILEHFKRSQMVQTKQYTALVWQDIIKWKKAKQTKKKSLHSDPMSLNIGYICTEPINEAGRPQLQQGCRYHSRGINSILFLCLWRLRKNDVPSVCLQPALSFCYNIECNVVSHS